MVVEDADTEGLALSEGVSDTELESFREREAVFVEDTELETRAVPLLRGLVADTVWEARVEAEGAAGVEDCEVVSDAVFDTVVLEDTEGEAEPVFENEEEAVSVVVELCEGVSEPVPKSLGVPPNMSPPLKARLHWVAECVGERDSVPVVRGVPVLRSSRTVLEGAAVLVVDAEARAEALRAGLSEAERESRPEGECVGDSEPPPIKAA